MSGLSRLTDLIAKAKAKDLALGQELEREFKTLSARRSFGLNFERHRPESVELPGRPVRKGDKVRILPLRGSATNRDDRLWRVAGFEVIGSDKLAKLELLNSSDTEQETVLINDLAKIAEFKDYIYPGLVSTGRVDRGGDRPYHTVINGENFHVLEALTFTHRASIDAIYIDPPYNSGAKDWKYNNNYIEKEDVYRHSKWLAFLERRLLIARQLLNPNNSVLIVSIDEKEYLRLGLLLEQVFQEARIQMVSSVINPSGVARPREFYRVDEYIFFVYIGSAAVVNTFVPGLCISSDIEPNEPLDMTDDEGDDEVDVGRPIRWESLLRSGTDAQRTDREDMFYPVLVNEGTMSLAGAGDPLPGGISPNTYTAPEGLTAIWPIRQDGSDGRWKVGKKSLEGLITSKYAKLSPGSKTGGKLTPLYLPKGLRDKLKAGVTEVVGADKYGGLEIAFRQNGGDGEAVPLQTEGRPKTQWNTKAHSATDHGSSLIRKLIPGRKFPFPKSLYAVEDALRFFVADKKNATVLDFFSGSGTTAHAVMRLNKQDGGRRQSICITNNEVSANEQSKLRTDQLRPGDAEWERWGICDYITKPRVAAAITGTTPEGTPIKGAYKFTDEFPISDGFEENAEFFTLTYETPVAVSHNRAFERIAPLLWLRAGSEGRRIDVLPSQGWDVADSYALLTDLDRSAAFVKAINAVKNVRIAFIVTDDERRYQSVTRQLSAPIEPVRLYESYLTNFRFAMGR